MKDVPAQNIDRLATGHASAKVSTGCWFAAARRIARSIAAARLLWLFGTIGNVLPATTASFYPHLNQIGIFTTGFWCFDSGRQDNIAQSLNRPHLT